MKNLLLPLLISICGCFSSCSFVRNEQIIGKYHILAIDTSDKPCLAYELENKNYICIIPSNILAYCKNEQYIFLKQMPHTNKDTTNINYYIVPILKDNPTVFPEDHIIGPITEKRFSEEILKMDLRNLKFKKLDKGFKL